MRVTAFLIASGLCVCAAAASAGQIAGHEMTTEAPLVHVHHKPGHAGGPPWTRRNQSRDDWRAERRYERGFSNSYTERRPACRTVYRTYLDEFTGDYIRRPVRVCD